MYKLTVDNAVYTMPESSLKLLAMTKAKDLGKFVPLETDGQAIYFLESIGIEVELYE